MEIPLTGAVGLALAVTRAGGFAVASPLLRAFPPVGRLAFTLGVGLALSRPVDTLVAGAIDVPGLVLAAAVNTGTGLVLGFLTGILLHVFETAGALIDLTSGLNASQMFDPLTGTPNAVLGRAFHLTALVLWLVLGGDLLAVEGLAATVAAIPLDGSLRISTGLATAAVELGATLLASAVRLAAPALAALFLAEVLFGVTSRFAPQANIFAVGLPAKLVTALLTVGFVVAAFPATVSGALGTTRDLIVTTVRGLGG